MRLTALAAAAAAALLPRCADAFISVNVGQKVLYALVGTSSGKIYFLGRNVGDNQQWQSSFTEVPYALSGSPGIQSIDLCIDVKGGLNNVGYLVFATSSNFAYRLPIKLYFDTPKIEARRGATVGATVTAEQISSVQNAQSVFCSGTQLYLSTTGKIQRAAADGPISGNSLAWADFLVSNAGAQPSTSFPFGTVTDFYFGSRSDRSKFALLSSLGPSESSRLYVTNATETASENVITHNGVSNGLFLNVSSKKFAANSETGKAYLVNGGAGGSVVEVDFANWNSTYNPIAPETSPNTRGVSFSHGVLYYMVDNAMKSLTPKAGAPWEAASVKSLIGATGTPQTFRVYYTAAAIASAVPGALLALFAALLSMFGARRAL